MKHFLPILFGLLVPVQASAVRLTDYGWDCVGFIYCGSNQDAVSGLSENLTIAVNNFIAVLAVVAFIYGAIRMIFSRGEEGKEAGKKAILYASIGFVLAILAGNIILYVYTLLHCIGATGPCQV